MKIKTGQTITENIISADANNFPVSAATFDVNLYKNGDFYESINIELSDDINAIFKTVWSASTIGDYQLYAKNNTTSVIYISDVYKVVPDEEIETNIYGGL